MTLSLDTVRDLLRTMPDRQAKLGVIYETLPPTRCRRRTSCCSLLPEMPLVESLTLFSCLATLPGDARLDLLRKILSWFFLNPVQITTCPFLAGHDCLIYRDRFFGCRAYGLWSPAYYETLSTANRQAKTHIRQQWRNLGVELPEAVIQFQVPYCRNVEPAGENRTDDRVIQEAWDRVVQLSEQLAPWHQIFQEHYFFDPAFLVASLLFGMNRAVRLKYNIVRGIVAGDRSLLDMVLEETSDPFDALVADRTG